MNAGVQVDLRIARCDMWCVPQLEFLLNRFLYIVASLRRLNCKRRRGDEVLRGVVKLSSLNFRGRT